MSPIPWRKASIGSTLVEVVLAIGVLAIGSIFIWEGLTTGVERTSDLRNITQTAQIRDYLLTVIEGGTNSVATLTGTTYYFDNEGLRVAGSSNSWAYLATVGLASGTTPVAIPNAPSNTNLLAVKIQVQPRTGTPNTTYHYFVTP